MMIDPSKAKASSSAGADATRPAVYVTEDFEYDDSASESDEELEVVLDASSSGVMAARVAQTAVNKVWQSGVDEDVKREEER